MNPMCESLKGSLRNLKKPCTKPCHVVKHGGKRLALNVRRSLALPPNLGAVAGTTARTCATTGGGPHQRHSACKVQSRPTAQKQSQDGWPYGNAQIPLANQSALYSKLASLFEGLFNAAGKTGFAPIQDLAFPGLPKGPVFGALVPRKPDWTLIQ